MPRWLRLFQSMFFSIRHHSQTTEEAFNRKAVLTMELLDNNAASLTDNRLAPLKSVYFGSNEGRGPVPSVQP